MTEIDNSPIPILMYHDIELQPRERKYKHFYVLASDLEWQMAGLKKAGYTPITFDQLGAGISGAFDLPTKPIILTFDDGYRNVIKLAHPIFSEFKFCYTVFVVTGKIGGKNDWVADEGYETSPLMDWSEIAEIRSSGLADIQAHTVSHRRLTELSSSELHDELLASRETIEEKFGTAVRTICYPWGSYNESVIESAASAGYTFGVTTDFGRVKARENLLKLPRVSIHHVPPFSFDYGIARMNYWWKVRSRVDKRP